VNLLAGTQHNHDIRFLGRDSNRGPAEHYCAQVPGDVSVRCAPLREDVGAFAVNFNAITGGAWLFRSG
jgi:hypothetical protein